MLLHGAVGVKNGEVLILKYMDGEMRYGNRPNRPCDQMRLVWTHTKGCRMAASSMPVLTKG